MSDNGKIIGALLIGAAAGAALGLLFAPSKGSELRGKIKDNADDLMDELSKKIKEGKETLSDLKDKASSKVDEMKGRVEEEFEGIKNKAKQTVSSNNSMHH